MRSGRKQCEGTFRKRSEARRAALSKNNNGPLGILKLEERPSREHWNRAPSVGELTFGPRIRDTQPMVASTPQPPSGGMVGKKELLQWASQASGRIVTTFDELKDGDVLLRCMKETWPAAYDRCRRKGQPRSVSGNFELMGNMFDHLELPKSVLDTRGIQHASFKSCYNFLVMAFFLKNLATHSDFSVDFTHPVDSKLAAFLQAPESVASLHKGGALAPPGGGSAPRASSRAAPSSARFRRERRPRAAVRRRAAPATTRWSRRPPRRSGPSARRARERGGQSPRPARRHVHLPASSKSRATAAPPRAAARSEPSRERRERRAHAPPPAPPPASMTRERSALQQARDARRGSQASRAAGTSRDRRRRAEGVGESRAASRLAPRPRRTGGGGSAPPARRRRRRPRIDGSSSDYGTSDGDMAPGGPPETNAAPRGLTRGAVAEILSRPRAARGGVDPATAGFADGGAAFGGHDEHPAFAASEFAVSVRRRRGFESGVAPNAPNARAVASIVRAACAAPRPRPRRLRSALGQRRRRRPRGDAAGGGALRAGAAASAPGRVAAGAGLARAKVRRGARGSSGEVHRVDARRRGRRARAHRRAGASARRRTQRGSARVPPRAAAGGRGGGGGEDRRRRARGAGCADARRDAEARVRARLDAVRGREVRALEARVESLETERARLAEALRAATEAARVDDDKSIGDSAASRWSDVAEKSPAAASAIRRERAKIAELAQRVRVLEATLEGERAGREREREESKQGAEPRDFSFEFGVGIGPTGRAVRIERQAAAVRVASSRGRAVPGQGAAREDRFEPGRSEPLRILRRNRAKPRTIRLASGRAYRRILAEQRGERKVVRLEAELAKLRTHNEALRRQMRATQEASFEDVAVVPPSDPAEADAMRRAEDEAHRLGAEGAADDAAALLKAIDALRVAASRSTRRDARATAAGTSSRARSPRRRTPKPRRGVARHRRRRAATEDGAFEARREPGARRSKTNAPRPATPAARGERSSRTWRRRGTRRSSCTAASAPPAASALPWPRRRRSWRGRRRGRRRARADAFAARDAATGASAGALREARDEAAKLRLRESHWVGLIGCHRESSRVSRELAELAAARGEAASARRGRRGGPRRGARAPPRRRRGRGRVPRRGPSRRSRDMIEVRAAAVAGGRVEFGRAVDRAEAAEASLNATRDRLHVKSEEAAALALKAKRHELRAAEESAERERAQRRAESVAAELARLSDETSLNQRRASEEMVRAREELARLREALDDRDAALGAGAELVERDPELARTVSEGKALARRRRRHREPRSPRRRVGDEGASRRRGCRKRPPRRRRPDGAGSSGRGGSRESSPKEGPGRGTPVPGGAARPTRRPTRRPSPEAPSPAPARWPRPWPPRRRRSSPPRASPPRTSRRSTPPRSSPRSAVRRIVRRRPAAPAPPYDFLIAGGSAPRTNPLDDLAAAASAFKRGGVDESFGSSAPTQSTSKRARRHGRGRRRRRCSSQDVRRAPPCNGSALSSRRPRRGAAPPPFRCLDGGTPTRTTPTRKRVSRTTSRERWRRRRRPPRGCSRRFLRRSPSPGKTRMDISPGALENPRVSRIRAESVDEAGGMSRGTSSENLSVMTGPDSPPSEGAASSLPGADEFLHKADKRLEIKVEKSWFGLGSSPSPGADRFEPGEPRTSRPTTRGRTEKTNHPRRR